MKEKSKEGKRGEVGRESMPFFISNALGRTHSLLSLCQRSSPPVFLYLPHGHPSPLCLTQMPQLLQGMAQRMKWLGSILVRP